MTHTGMTDIVGEKGVVRILDGDLKVEWWHKSNDAVGGMAMGSLPDNFPIRSPLRNAVNDLLACIEHSDLTPLCSGEDGRTAFEMIAAIHLSDRAGRAVVPFPLTDVEHIIPSN
jgi:predicted dehydrogenase